MTYCEYIVKKDTLLWIASVFRKIFRCFGCNHIRVTESLSRGALDWLFLSCFPFIMIYCMFLMFLTYIYRLWCKCQCWKLDVNVELLLFYLSCPVIIVFSSLWKLKNSRLYFKSFTDCFSYPVNRMLQWRFYRFLSKSPVLFVSFLLVVQSQMLLFVNQILLVVL